MGTNYAPLVVDLFLFCYERGFMSSFSDNNRADVVEATSRYLDDLLNIDNPYFEISLIRKPPFLDLDLSITNGIFNLEYMINGMILILK